MPGQLEEEPLGLKRRKMLEVTTRSRAPILPQPNRGYTIGRAAGGLVAAV